MKKSQITNLILFFSLIFICSCEKNEVGVAPIAEFSADTTEVMIGVQIQFTDESKNNPTNWRWDFGDGGTSTSQNPTYTYSSVGNYTVSLSSTNSYGSDSVLKTNYISVNRSKIGILTDTRDGKTYKTVQIENQVWMAENLNYKTTSGSWIYNYYSNNALTYGRLYDWETANSACPNGWHLPSDDEWKQLEMAIGMSQFDADRFYGRGTGIGSKLKATIGWDWDGNGTDEYGFAALPGGYRIYDGSFLHKGNGANFWSSTLAASGSLDAWYRGLYSDGGNVYRFFSNRDYGYSVRCVKD